MQNYITLAEFELIALVIDGNVITTDQLSDEEINAARTDLFGQTATTDEQDTSSAGTAAN